jgi:histone acetyltransferase 1
VEAEDETFDRSWCPPGELVKKYGVGGKNFEIWCANLGDSRARRMFRNMQIMVPFYIEGGTQQRLDDPEWTMKRWKLFLLYDVTPPTHDKEATSHYVLAGFSTSYRLWVFPSYDNTKAVDQLPLEQSDLSPEDAEAWTPPTPPWDDEIYNYKQPSNFSPTSTPSRERISQFVIFPPYQRQSHGTHLYNAMYNTLTDPNVVELTVEDPNESFDDLRDWCDLPRLRSDSLFSKLSIPAKIPDEDFKRTSFVPVDKIVDQEVLGKLRRRFKISPRQFSRLTEMHLLSTIPPHHRETSRITRKNNAPQDNDRRYFYWRCLVKARIYERNIDQLAQLDREERIIKVEESCAAVQEEYRRLLEGAEKRKGWVGEVEVESNGANNASTTGPGIVKRKRKVIEEDSEEEDEDAVSGAVAGKKPKVAE